MKLIETTAAITAISEYFNTLAGTGYTGHESAGIPKAIEDILNALPPAPAVPLEVHEKMKRDISERIIPKRPLTETINHGLDITGEYNIECNYLCPNCKSVVGDYEYDEIFKFCPDCGQALTLENMPQEDTENSVVFNDFMKKSEV